jgi:general secretion pathway protein J
MRRNSSGFTLLEILVALFVFTILAAIMAGVLQHMLTTQTVTEKHASRLAELQIALLILSHDVEQSVDRPIRNSSGEKEPAFLGTPHSMTFTHGGVISPLSTLQRTRYAFAQRALTREAWLALDPVSATAIHQRDLLHFVDQVSFQYYDDEHNAYSYWPSRHTKTTLPRAVRVSLTLDQWGTINQLFIIAGNNFASGQ